MFFPRICFGTVRKLVLGSLAMILAGHSASAWQWKDEPQPLLNGDNAIRADAGSPLAWDDSWRVLWFVREGLLGSAWWTGATFKTPTSQSVGLDPAGGLFVDSGVHFIYFLNSERQPVCFRKKGSQWIQEVISQKPVRILLGVDERRHRVFAYDEAARSIQAYQFDPKGGTWTAQVVATGLGVAGDAGVVDSVRGVIYTVHASADESIPRAEGMPPLMAAGSEELLSKWPMVATQWVDDQWTSRVICDTGVPQQPALHPSDGSVFFARIGDPRSLHHFTPASGKAPESYKVTQGWSGADTYVDEERYQIRVPKYPRHWGNNNGGYSGFWNFSGGYERGSTFVYGLPKTEIALTPPISIVPYWEPVWTNTPVSPRIAHFRAVMNPRQQQLVQHRQVHEGEVIREQTGMRFMGYVYRDANGVIARQLYQTSSGGYPLDGRYTGFQLAYPQNPPLSFPPLGATGEYLGTYKPEPVGVTGQYFGTYKSELVGAAISPECTINQESPWVPAHLLQPTSIALRTFGHTYASRKEDQKGGRYRNYFRDATALAITSSIAVDQRTGMTFYTQAPSTSGANGTSTRVVAGDGSRTTVAVEDASLSTFHSRDGAKFVRPTNQQVWIVTVY